MSKGCKIDVYITMELRDSVKLLASIKICLNYTYFLFHYVALVSYYFLSRLPWQLFGQSTKQTLVFINTYKSLNYVCTFLWCFITTLIYRLFCWYQWYEWWDIWEWWWDMMCHICGEKIEKSNTKKCYECQEKTCWVRF